MIILFSSNIFIFPIIASIQNNATTLFIANVGFYLLFFVLTLIFLGKKGLIFFIRFLLYSIYTLTWIPITIQGILRKNNKEWNPTKHVRNVEIYDV